MASVSGNLQREASSRRPVSLRDLRTFRTVHHAAFFVRCVPCETDKPPVNVRTGSENPGDPDRESQQDQTPECNPHQLLSRQSIGRLRGDDRNSRFEPNRRGIIWHRPIAAPRRQSQMVM